MYLGGHGSYGEDGLELIAEKAIGRDDYGSPQCRSFGKRSNKGDCGSEVSNSRQPRAGPLGMLNALFGQFTHRNRRRHRRRHFRTLFHRRQGMLPRDLEARDITFTNDIALVKLRHKIKFSAKIQPVRLPRNDQSYLGYQCYVSGWGIQSPSQGPSLHLKGAELVVVDGTQTRGCLAQSGHGKLCALSLDDFNGKAGAACPGDSGSPLVTYDTRNGGWTLIGLLSNGAKSCFKGMPEIYTKVGDYLDWIYETINQNDHSVP